MSELKFHALVSALALLLLLSALALVMSRHYNRVAFGELQTAQGARDDLSMVYGQLQLELGAWGSYGRIEKLARERLGMNRPESGDIVLIQAR